MTYNIQISESITEVLHVIIINLNVFHPSKFKLSPMSMATNSLVSKSLLFRNVVSKDGGSR